jgi:hypothetical protein
MTDFLSEEVKYMPCIHIPAGMFNIKIICIRNVDTPLPHYIMSHFRKEKQSSIIAAPVSVLVIVLNNTGHPDLQTSVPRILFMETHGKIWCDSKKWKKMYYCITF